jgi:Sec-independent protein translocase protein TatA
MARRKTRKSASKKMGTKTTQPIPAAASPKPEGPPALKTESSKVKVEPLTVTVPPAQSEESISNATEFTGEEKLKLLSSVVDAAQRLPTHGTSSPSATPEISKNIQYPTPANSRSPSPNSKLASIEENAPLPTLSETLCRIFPKNDKATKPQDQEVPSAVNGRVKIPALMKQLPPPTPQPCLPHLVPKGAPRHLRPQPVEGPFIFQGGFGILPPISSQSPHPFTNGILPNTPPSTPTDFNLGPAKGKLKQFSFVNIPGVSNKKRPRRKYDDVERHYECNFSGCTKSYGTLNHLNAHVTMQKHGPKRLASEFKDLRKQLKKTKQDKEKDTTGDDSAEEQSETQPTASNSNSDESLQEPTTLSAAPDSSSAL